MAEFQVTASTLKSKAEELKALNESLSQKIQELEAAKVRLDSTWEGDAKTAFATAFNNDKVKMDMFKQNIDNCYARLMNIVAQYEIAESRAQNIAATRTV